MLKGVHLVGKIDPNSVYADGAVLYYEAGRLKNADRSWFTKMSVRKAIQRHGGQPGREMYVVVSDEPFGAMKQAFDWGGLTKDDLARLQHLGFFTSPQLNLPDSSKSSSP